MIKNIIRCFKANELLLLALLMLLLAWNHSTGMVTILTVWCLFFIYAIPSVFYKGRLFIGILLFTFFYSSFGLLTGYMTLTKLIGLCFPMVLLYVLGKFLVVRLNNPMHLMLLLAILLICYQLEVYTSFLSNYIANGYSINSSREFYLGGDSSRKLTATLVGLNISVGMVGLGTAVITKQHNLIRFLYLLLFLLSISITVFLLNRTGLVIALVCNALMFCYFYFNNKRALFFILLSVIAVIVLADYMGWNDSYIMQAYADRNSDLQSAGLRTMKWAEAFKTLFQYPFGWAEFSPTRVYYAHNMWLDIARVAGIFPFIVLVVISLKALLIQIRILKIGHDPLVALTTGLNVCFCLSCFVEPVQGGFHLFLWAMVWGIQEQYLSLKYSKRGVILK